MNITIDRKKIIIIIAILVIAMLAVALKFYVVPKMRAEGNFYSVVYLTTGEVYIGRLTTWPRMELNDTYLLQNVNVKDKDDQTKTSIQLTPLKDALWAPKKLFINEENVLFYGPLEESSKAAEAIRNAGK